jgi:hypothetical protein
VQPVGAHRLPREPVHRHPAVARDRLLPGQQVVVRLGLLLDDQPLEIEPEARLWDRQVAALREHGQAFPVMVEILNCTRCRAPLRSPQSISRRSATLSRILRRRARGLTPALPPFREKGPVYHRTGRDGRRGARKGVSSLQPDRPRRGRSETAPSVRRIAGCSRDCQDRRAGRLPPQIKARH